MAGVRKRGKKFVLDYRMDGKRERVTLDTREEAEELCQKFNALKRAEKLHEFNSLLSARNALIEAEIKLTGKTLAEAIFEYAKAISKGKSDQSQKNERSDFKNLFAYLTEEKSVHYLREVTPPMLVEYQRRLLDNVSPSTCNRRFNVFKHFFNTCVEWEYLEKSPARMVKTQKVKPKPRKTFTDNEVEAIGRKLKPHERRAWYFAAIQGTRPGEGPSARVGDFNPERQTLTVYCGKGSSLARTLQLHPTAQAIIEEILSERINLNADDFIFLNSRGHRLRPSVVTKAVRLACEELGIEEGKTPYGLRHTFATKLARANVAAEKTRRLMGHASSRTTEHYYKLEDQDLRETMDEVAKIFDFETGEELKTVNDGHRVG